LKSYYKAVPKIIISTSDTDTSELVLLKSVGFEEQDQKILEYS
ncbi:N-acetyltransferase, partial [Ligilactobacillus salivarius]